MPSPPHRFPTLRGSLAALALALSSREARAQAPRVHAVEASLYGHQLTHPGAQVGYTLRVVGTANDRHALVVGADVGGYLWPRHSVGVFVLPRVGYRIRGASGLQGEVNLHVGYLQGVLASEAFDVVEGRVVSASRAGFPYLLVGPTVGVGYTVPRTRVTPFIRAGLHWQLPVFDQSLMRLVAAAGVAVAL